VTKNHPVSIEHLEKRLIDTHFALCYIEGAKGMFSSLGLVARPRLEVSPQEANRETGPVVGLCF
jgi:hypothetical protein